MVGDFFDVVQHDLYPNIDYTSNQYSALIKHIEESNPGMNILLTPSTQGEDVSEFEGSDSRSSDSSDFDDCSSI